MYFIKRFLFKALGLRRYLKFLSRVFFFSYQWGMLKNNPEYYCHYFVKKLINKGDTIIDIGANLGYYSRTFGQLTGKNGKVLAVEPVALFRDILQTNIKKYPQVEVLPYALGEENGTEIKMGLPATNKYLSHGRTKIMSSRPDDEYAYEFTAEMRNPADLFRNVAQIDYIKCDIEGYETVVIPQMKPLIERHKPIIQIESDGDNRQKIINLLQPMGYTAYYIDQNKPLIYNANTAPIFTGDLIFITPERINSSSQLKRLFTA